MPLPPELDKKIRERFEELEIEAKRILSMRPSGFPTDKYISDFEALKIKTLNLLQNIKARDSQLIEYIRKSSYHDISTLHGWIVAYKDDYEKGFLDDLTQMIETNVNVDYMRIAEQVFQDNTTGTPIDSYVPAGILAGAVLENALRTLCQRKGINIFKPSGDYKALNALIEDLQKATVFSAAQGDILRGYAKIRNDLAHGHFTNVTRQKVENMINEVKDFIAKNL